MDFKDRMIEAVERGHTTEAEAYEYVRENLAAYGDLLRKREREEADLRSEIGGEGGEEGSGTPS